MARGREFCVRDRGKVRNSEKVGIKNEQENRIDGRRHKMAYDPRLALLPYLKQEGSEVIYIGSQNGIERTLIEAEGIPYYGISTGKLRRYLSKENLKDVFKVLKGISEAKRLLKKLKPDLVFSKWQWLCG